MPRNAGINLGEAEHPETPLRVCCCCVSCLTRTWVRKILGWHPGNNLVYTFEASCRNIGTVGLRSRPLVSYGYQLRTYERLAIYQIYIHRILIVCGFNY
jgi:hypothetical protein